MGGGSATDAPTVSQRPWMTSNRAVLRFGLVMVLSEQRLEDARSADERSRRDAARNNWSLSTIGKNRKPKLRTLRSHRVPDTPRSATRSTAALLSQCTTRAIAFLVEHCAGCERGGGVRRRSLPPRFAPTARWCAGARSSGVPHR